MAEDIAVTFVKGKAFVANIENDKDLKSMSKELVIKEDQRIITSDNGFVVIKINNHSHHRIEENSEVIIHQLPYFYEDSLELEQGAVFEVIKGVIFSEVKSTSGMESLKVVVNKTAIGVRGTKLFVANNDDGSALLGVNTGVVEIIGQKGRQEDYLEASEAIEVGPKGIFSKRQKFNFLKKIDWNIKAHSRNVSYSSLLSEIRSEIKKRRQNWSQDSKRFTTLKKHWQQNQEQRRIRVDSLTPSKKLQLRKKLKSKLRRGKLNKNEQSKLIRTNSRSTLKERFKNLNSDTESSTNNQNSKLRKKIHQKLKKIQSKE